MGKDASLHPQSHKALMLLASIDPTCFLESTAAALRSKESSELTWEYVATTLIDGYNAKRASGGTSSHQNSRRKGWRRNKKPNNSDPRSNTADSDDSGIDSAARVVAAALQTANINRSGNSSTYH